MAVLLHFSEVRTGVECVGIRIADCFQLNLILLPLFLEGLIFINTFAMIINVIEFYDISEWE